MQLLVASENEKKRRELELALARLGVRLLGPREVGGLPEVVEDGASFAANAAKKAASGALASGRFCLADDSGLVVDALGGRPGVHSARFAGEHGDDAANNAKLLAELAGVPAERRTARFACALALARPDGSLALAVAGEARGRILAAARGAGGFGYDPLFAFTEEPAPGASPEEAAAIARARGRTFAELSADEKSRVSHRARAVARLAAELPRLLQESPA